jgi:hypothetical protein
LLYAMRKNPEDSLKDSIYYRNLVMRFAPRFPWLYIERAGERKLSTYRLHQFMQTKEPQIVSNFFSGNGRPNMYHLGPVIYNLMDIIDSKEAEIAELKAEIASLQSSSKKKEKVAATVSA